MSVLPEPTFEFLVVTLGMQAQMHMGMLVPDPSQQPEMNLPMARHMIDMLAMIQKKTAGNLNMEETRMVENTLTELRFRYVQATEAHAKAVSEKATLDSAAPAETQP
jgi:Domain of unknown function (DUF1844)